ncbi:hypothetical protein KSS87_005319 [Heliosperma pusillum]|nr:hypothetical protein KSS87_005319 [Heliosperma pusillum]
MWSYSTAIMMRKRGNTVYNLYKSLTTILSPFLHLHLHWRKFRGLEHSSRFPERLGIPSLRRPPGILLWFHAVSLGKTHIAFFRDGTSEGMAAIPVIQRCLIERPDLNILMTTTTVSGFSSVRQSTTESMRFQLLQAPPFIISTSADLKYAVGGCTMSMNSLKNSEDLRLQLSQRLAWMASSIHKAELEVILHAHKKLLQSHKSLLTVIVPRHPEHGYKFAQSLREEGFDVAVRRDGDKLTSATNVYMVNTLGELRELYKLMPIAVIGGSFLSGLAGHNISEAMASGCAVLTGPHIGHFSHMVSAMQRFNNLSVLQVSKESELAKALHELLSDPVTLEARQSAAKQAFNALSRGVLAHVWIQLDRFILRGLPI